MKGDFVTLTTFDLPYDYESLMHYPGNAFAKRGKDATMISRVYFSHLIQLYLSHNVINFTE